MLNEKYGKIKSLTKKSLCLEMLGDFFLTRWIIEVMILLLIGGGYCQKILCMQKLILREYLNSVWKVLRFFMYSILKTFLKK